MNYYKSSDMDNPEGPDFTIWHVLRGGSVFDEETSYVHRRVTEMCRGRRSSNTGIRLAR